MDAQILAILKQGADGSAVQRPYVIVDLIICQALQRFAG
jgi:hypothetical protein